MIVFGMTTVLPSEDVYEHNFTNFESFNKDDSEIQNSTTLKNQELEAQCRPNPPLNFCHSNCCKFFNFIEYASELKCTDLIFELC